MVWQVKLLDVSQLTGVSCATPDGSIPPWESLIQPSGAQLTTAVVPSATSGPCCLNTATGYTGIENQIYRVEIHQGGGAAGAIGISTANAAAATITGNDISDIGPQRSGGNDIIFGISILADTVGIANAANNVIRQTTSGVKDQIPFMRILIGPNVEPSSPDGFTGAALVNGNMIFGNDAYLVNTLVADCVLSGNLCDLAANLPADPSAAVMAAFGDTCIASNNRILGAGKLTGLSVSVSSIKDLAKATVVRNIVSTAILLNGTVLPPP